MRRDDVWATEFWIRVDPRDERYQWPVEEVKRIMELPKYQPIERVREAMGVPMPPISLMKSALEKMRNERAQASGRVAAKSTSTDDTQAGAKKEKKTIDLSSIDSEFLAYKGIQLTKKQKAAAASKKSRR